MLASLPLPLSTPPCLLPSLSPPHPVSILLCLLPSMSPTLPVSIPPCLYPSMSLPFSVSTPPTLSPVSAPPGRLTPYSPPSSRRKLYPLISEAYSIATSLPLAPSTPFLASNHILLLSPPHRSLFYPVPQFTGESHACRHSSHHAKPPSQEHRKFRSHNVTTYDSLRDAQVCIITR